MTLENIFIVDGLFMYVASVVSTIIIGIVLSIIILLIYRILHTRKLLKIADNCIKSFICSQQAKKEVK